MCPIGLLPIARGGLLEFTNDVAYKSFGKLLYICSRIISVVFKCLHKYKKE